MGHEKLECYQLLLKVARELRMLIMSWPRGFGYLADQMTRAMASSVLTLAEGNGKRTNPKERRRFFQMSLGSIAEVSACIDLAEVFNLMSGKGCVKIKDMLDASYCMIRKLP